MKSHKRLLTEEYAIKFPPGPAKKYPSGASISKPNRQKMQEEADYKLAMKIQRDNTEESPAPEVEVIEVKGSPSIKPDFSEEDEAVAVSSERQNVPTSHSDENSDENLDDIQFQADAAAALLHLS
ncbi:Hypothetical predicted protein [Paramuricea clavata]|uniref:Uncharacterized protein n=1 Tax=Paramuricea clavata TaxID=317549 RepID=A0A6S7H3K6_PARCT|nr:Hypothetical predicted protein [Paramuricea clavata]